MLIDKAHCSLCGARNHALGGWSKAGEFMLALPAQAGGGRATWPRIGTNGWCANADGEAERLSIIRITLKPSIINGQRAFLCQTCLDRHQAKQGVLTDLFSNEACR